MPQCGVISFNGKRARRAKWFWFRAHTQTLQARHIRLRLWEARQLSQSPETETYNRMRAKPVTGSEVLRRRTSGYYGLTPPVPREARTCSSTLPFDLVHAPFSRVAWMEVILSAFGLPATSPYLSEHILRIKHLKNYA